MNAEVIRLDAGNAPSFGVLLDHVGAAVALWLPIWSDSQMISVGVSVHLFMPFLKSLQQGIIPAECRTLAATFKAIDKADAGQLGVPHDIMPQFGERGFIQVRQIVLVGGMDLSVGDIILYANGGPVKCLWDLAPAASSESLPVTIIREGQTRSFNLSTLPTSNWHCKASVWFLGARIETPPFHMATRTRSLPSELVVTEIAPGSPADEFDIPKDSFITHIGDRATGDLKSFSQAIEKLKELEWCQVTVVRPNGLRETVPVLPNRFFRSKICQRSHSMPYEWKTRIMNIAIAVHALAVKEMVSLLPLHVEVVIGLGREDQSSSAVQIAIFMVAVEMVCKFKIFEKVAMMVNFVEPRFPVSGLDASTPGLYVAS